MNVETRWVGRDLLEIQVEFDDGKAECLVTSVQEATKLLEQFESAVDCLKLVIEEQSK